MGQVADDILNGSCCALCGVYFVDDHGYPVACSGCYDYGWGYQKAQHKDL